MKNQSKINSLSCDKFEVTYISPTQFSFKHIDTEVIFDVKISFESQMNKTIDELVEEAKCKILTSIENENLNK